MLRRKNKVESVLIGKIVNVHGIKGEVKIYPYTDDISNLLTIKEVYMDENLTSKYLIQSSKVHKDMLITKFEGISNPEDAIKLKDKNIYILKSSLKKLDEGTYYICDLIGIQVFDVNENKIGILSDVQNVGSNDVYEIITLDKKKIYLPAIHDVIKKIDINSKKMYVEIMEGLI